MTRDEQIRKALELLAPPADELEVCRHEICLALDRVARSTEFALASRAGRSKKKGGLLRYHAALLRLISAFDSLDPAMKPWFSAADPAYPTRKAIDADIANAEVVLDQQSEPPRPDGSRNKAAAAAAYDLLTWRGHKATVTRGGLWEKLTQTLAGTTVDVFDHLRKFKQKPSPPVEKIRNKTGDISYMQISVDHPFIKRSDND